MIAHLRGIYEERTADGIIIDVGGLGYAVMVPISTVEKLPAPGREVKLFIVESFAMYGGGASLYGFLTREERDIFTLLRDEVPGAGAKKALDYLDKVTKSLPDFKRCVAERDIAALVSIFGFTKKTAEKLAAALKDKIGSITVSGAAKWSAALTAASPEAEAISGLVGLGYRDNQAREAVEKVMAVEKDLAVPEIIRRSLRYLS